MQVTLSVGAFSLSGNMQLCELDYLWLKARTGKAEDPDRAGKITLLEETILCVVLYTSFTHSLIHTYKRHMAICTD